MANATINLKKTTLTKSLCAFKIKGVKVKSMVPVGEELITEVDFRNPKDLYEAGQLEHTLTGKEYKTDELMAKLLPDAVKAK